MDSGQHAICPDCGVAGSFARILRVFWADALPDRAQIEQWRCPEGHVWKVGRRRGRLRGAHVSDPQASASGQIDTEHWFLVAGYALSSVHGPKPDEDGLREVRGRIALLFRQLDPEHQAAIVAMAHTFTSTNCWWAKYDVGGIVLGEVERA